MGKYPTDYEAVLADVLENGVKSTDRTGTGTIRKFGVRMVFDLATEFPLITSKRVHWNGVRGELLWMLSGSTNAQDLKDKYGVRIWDEWAKAGGELGPIYGKQWRAWESTTVERLGMGERIVKKKFDQIRWVVDQIRKHPDSRRLIVSAWNVADLDEMALMPCHTMFQFSVLDGKLSCQLYQRSADMFLGVPFNIASYALLTHMVARVCGLEVGVFTHVIGDAHIYQDHVTQVVEQLSRPDDRVAPTLTLSGTYQYPWEFTPADIVLTNYHPHTAIKAKVSV